MLSIFLNATQMVNHSFKIKCELYQCLLAIKVLGSVIWFWHYFQKSGIFFMHSRGLSGKNFMFTCSYMYHENKLSLQRDLDCNRVRKHQCPFAAISALSSVFSLMGIITQTHAWHKIWQCIVAISTSLDHSMLRIFFSCFYLVSQQLNYVCLIYIQQEWLVRPFFSILLKRVHCTEENNKIVFVARTLKSIN